jgi:hypothetical protein
MFLGLSFVGSGFGVIRIWGQASEIRYFLFLSLIRFSSVCFKGRKKDKKEFNQAIFKMV